MPDGSPPATGSAAAQDTLGPAASPLGATRW